MNTDDLIRMRRRSSSVGSGRGCRGSKSSTLSDGLSVPWYKNEKLQYLAFLTLVVCFCLGILLVSTKLKSRRTVLYITSHQGTSVLAIDAHSGKILTDSAFDMSEVADPKHVQLRGLVSVKGEVWVADGAKHKGLHDQVLAFSCCSQSREWRKLAEHCRVTLQNGSLHSVTAVGSIEDHTMCQRRSNSSGCVGSMPLPNRPVLWNNSVWSVTGHKCRDSNRMRTLPFINRSRLGYDNSLCQHSSEESVRKNGLPQVQAETVDRRRLRHPYGLAYDDTRDVLYISNQNTNNVLQFNVTSHRMLSSPEIFKHPCKKSSVRGICVDSSLQVLFVAVECAQAIFAVDSRDGRILFNITLRDIQSDDQSDDGSTSKSSTTAGSSSSSSDENSQDPLDYADGTGRFRPIGLHCETQNNAFNQTLFFGDRGNHLVSAVIYDRSGVKHLWTSQPNSRLKHPAGLTLSNEALYVVSQKHGSIEMFEPNTGNYIGTLVRYTDHKEYEDFTAEQILLIQDSCV